MRRSAACMEARSSFSAGSRRVDRCSCSRNRHDSSRAKCCTRQGEITLSVLVAEVWSRQMPWKRGMIFKLRSCSMCPGSRLWVCLRQSKLGTIFHGLQSFLAILWPLTNIISSLSIAKQKARNLRPWTGLFKAPLDFAGEHWKAGPRGSTASTEQRKSKQVAADCNTDTRSMRIRMKSFWLKHNQTVYCLIWYTLGVGICAALMSYPFIHTLVCKDFIR